MDSSGPNSAGQRYSLPSQLMSPDVVGALCSVLDDGNGSSVPASSLRWAASIVCRDAHARNYRVETLLAELKPEWSALLDSLHFPRGAERNEVTNHFIADCIDEYFRLDSNEDDECRGVGRGNDAMRPSTLGFT